ncbi:hypothetical protein Tco_0164254 [Tanacetum coccineum]
MGGRRITFGDCLETAPHCDSRCLFCHKVYYHFEGRQIWNGEFLAPFEGRLSVQFDLKEIMAVLFVNQQKYFEFFVFVDQGFQDSSGKGLSTLVGKLSYQMHGASLCEIIMTESFRCGNTYGFVRNDVCLGRGRDGIFLGDVSLLRWVEAKMVSPEVESEKWRRLLPHWMYDALNISTDGREEDFVSRQ